MAPAAPHHADNNNQDSAAKKVYINLVTAQTYKQTDFITYEYLPTTNTGDPAMSRTRFMCVGNYCTAKQIKWV